MYMLFDIMKNNTSILAILIFIYTIVLAVIRPKMQERLLIFRLLCIVPVLACSVHFYFSYFRGIYGFSFTMDIYQYLYIGALLPLLLIIPINKKLPRKLLSVFVSLAVFISSTAMIFNQTNYSKVHNFTTLGWSDGFKEIVEVMRKEYVLSDWKEVDYDALLEEFLPRIEEAEKNNNKAAYGATLTEYVHRFNDGHVSISLSPEVSVLTKELLAGNDYGFSMYTIDSGETIAVSVDEESDAYKAGIRNGTVITKWDGEDISEAVAKVECIYPRDSMTFPVESNEDYFRPMFLAGKGGDSVKVNYIDDSGKNSEVMLDSQGSYVERLETTINNFLNIGLTDENYYTTMISDNCGYLRISYEEYSMIWDNVSIARDGYYPQLTDFFDEKLEELKAQGMQTLVIDIRNNSGGYNTVGGALASIFSDEKRFLFAFGEKDGEDYKRTQDLYVFPNGKWADLPVVVLVNQACFSAGDGMADCLSKLPNVTLMGITASNGINQNNGGICYLNDSDVIISYPDYLTLGEDNLPLIDTDASRECRIPLDVHIPVDKEAAIKIFGEDEVDYELEYAMEYINGLV